METLECLQVCIASLIWPVKLFCIETWQPARHGYREIYIARYTPGYSPELTIDSTHSVLLDQLGLP